MSRVSILFIMIVNGNEIAQNILKEVKQEISLFDVKPILAVVMVGENEISNRFVSLKKKVAESVGIQFSMHTLPESVSTEDVVSKIKTLGEEDEVCAIVVQLPLPKNIDTHEILSAIPTKKDIDVLSPHTYQLFLKNTLPILPPVVGAIEEIVNMHKVSLEGKKVVVVGRGRLVGRPVSVWFKGKGSFVSVVDETTPGIKEALKGADVIVSGAGVPSLIKANMVKDNAVLLDAGTSEVGGKFAGDIGPECSEKAYLFAPVPGGIGPITIAILLRNMLKCSKIDNS